MDRRREVGPVPGPIDQVRPGAGPKGRTRAATRSSEGAAATAEARAVRRQPSVARPPASTIRPETIPLCLVSVARTPQTRPEARGEPGRRPAPGAVPDGPRRLEPEQGRQGDCTAASSRPSRAGRRRHQGSGPDQGHGRPRRHDDHPPRRPEMPPEDDGRPPRPVRSVAAPRTRSRLRRRRVGVAAGSSTSTPARRPRSRRGPTNQVIQPATYAVIGRRGGGAGSV